LNVTSTWGGQKNREPKWGLGDTFSWGGGRLFGSGSIASSKWGGGDQHKKKEGAGMRPFFEKLLRIADGGTGET